MTEPPALLLHGQPSGPYWFTRLRGLLADERLVIAPERPGYGRNPLPATGFVGNADWVVGELDRLGIDQVAVCGHSWGGGVAMALALQYPERVSRLVLAASVGPDCLFRIDHVLAHPRIGPWVTERAYHTFARLAVRAARRELGPIMTAAERADFEKSIAATLARPDTVNTFYVEQRALVEEVEPLVARLGEINVPTAVLQGLRDRMIPKRTPALLAAAIPGATLRLVPGAPHDLLTTTAPLLAELLRDSDSGATPLEARTSSSAPAPQPDPCPP